MMKKFILLDIDNTLFDSATYRNTFSKELCALLKENGLADAEVICDEVYTALRVAKGLFAPEQFVDILVEKTKLPVSLKETLLEIIYNQQNVDKNLYTEVHKTLQEFAKYAELGIFSQGTEKLQQKKINSLQHFFQKDTLHIVEDKEKAIESIFAKYSDFDTYLIDDALPILHGVYTHYPQVKTIWMRRGIYADTQAAIPGFTPYATIFTLDQAIATIKE